MICCGLSALFPHFALIFVPILGSIFGIEIILRFSLFLYSYAILSSVCYEYRSLLEPVISFVYVLQFLIIPWNVPYIIVWLYNILLMWTEPVWQLVESVGAVKLIMTMSRELNEQMDDHSQLAKGIWNSLVGIAGTLTLYHMWSELAMKSWFYAGSMLGILLTMIFIIWLLHYLMEEVPETTVRVDVFDWVLLALCNTMYVQAMRTNYSSSSVTSHIPDSWNKLPQNSSWWSLLADAIHNGWYRSDHVVALVYSMLNTSFVVYLALRIVTILYCISLASNFITKHLNSSFDEVDAAEEEEHQINWRSPLLMTILINFTVTQHITNHLHYSHYATTFLNSLLVFSVHCLQIALLNGLYVYQRFILEEPLI